ncbi:3-isopropylmalate dehydrogenase [Natronogracilivirga saccharolytica]|uniref:3-isopropylmalate dehydrogenase n=1 Tax=Natronogracilivirga saccharolytica TaxID=2812953 RepID=A0A8J7RRR7_9BACT|nr:3-isopropylmalate dehydrogenase [Natronogracilivirga saccharolytica]MBP3192644.1 3-isopropylmalate dehydrogenase [Natronogracilivirga saccharolytica]
MSKKVVLLPGDGIGAEVVREAEKIIAHLSDHYGIGIETETHLVGGASLDAHDIPVKDEVVEACKSADAVLLGAVGGPKWDDYPSDKRPEKALLRLRKDLGLFNNLRPVTVFSSLKDASPLRPEVVDGVDLLVVRELTGGLYFGEPKEITEVNGEETGVDTMRYSVTEIERITRAAFDAARKRRGKVTSVDKANILATSQLWRKTVTRIAAEYPDVELEHMLVDNCAMQLIRNPSGFDVILTENMFGDILSDEAAMLTGSIGMLPSASLGDGTGMYEPVHGSAPDIAGKDIANPLATLASVALMFRFSLGHEKAASDIEEAISAVLNAGYNCKDMSRHARHVLSTSEMGDKILSVIIEKQDG